MTSWKLAGAVLVLACAGAPQDFAPGVVMLARIKAHLRDGVSHLPDYTCLETITRFHRESVHERLKPLDTVRLEIVYSGHHEWFGSPGEPKLGTGDPSRFVGSGLIGGGVFASTLNNVLSGGIFAYWGEDPLNGRAAVRYDFRFPRQPNAFEISMVGGAGTVGEKGSIWVDPQSLGLVRLDAHADEIPPYLPLAAQGTAIGYARAQIGGFSVVLAQQADVQLTEDSGATNYDRVEFTHCRAFSAESTISFDTEPGAAAFAKEPAAVSAAIPANHVVTVQLTTPVTSLDAVGKLIEGKIVGDVANKGAIVIHNGSIVRGRIRRLERYQGSGPAEFIVGLEFTEVEASGGPTPFYADLLRMDPVPGVRPSLTTRVVVYGNTEDKTDDETITLPELPGVASFFVGGDAFTLVAGFRTVWRTRGPIRGK